MNKVVKAGGRYRNIKTGNVYMAVANAQASWDVNEELVVYQREDGEDETVWVRSLTEFNEKFEIV
ncbi:hypothetical protein FACS1894200_10860 [Spirochaetia bacterium]|nr:hypothetical protein FACS1894200_10860 [Spirochaetia bacterium]